MSKTRISNFLIKKQLDKIHDLLMANQEDTFYEPLDYIQDPDKGERVYKYKGVYYNTNNIKHLYNAVINHTKYDKQLKAFREMVTDLSRNIEL